MKFYRYPLAIIAYSLLFVYGVAMAWYKVGGLAPASFWLLFPAFAGSYLLISFILSRLKLNWELDVLVQVVFVLAPILWFVNRKEAFKSPEYVFIVEGGYSGQLEIHFNYEKDAPTNARSTDDTVYFKFDGNGRMLINEAGEYVKKMMKKNLYIFHPDHRRERVSLENGVNVTANVQAKFDSAQVEKGKLIALYYSIHQ